jgi:hypothetical protein
MLPNTLSRGYKDGLQPETLAGGDTITLSTVRTFKPQGTPRLYVCAAQFKLIARLAQHAEFINTRRALQTFPYLTYCFV